MLWLTHTHQFKFSFWDESQAKGLNSKPWPSVTFQHLLQSRYIRTVSSWRLLSDLLNWYKLIHESFECMGKATCAEHMISTQTSQEEIDITKAKIVLPIYCDLLEFAKTRDQHVLCHFLWLLPHSLKSLTTTNTLHTISTIRWIETLMCSKLFSIKRLYPCIDPFFHIQPKNSVPFVTCWITKQTDFLS